MLDGADDTATAGTPARGQDGGTRSPAARRPSWQSRPVGYQPALDGLRAVAVALVVAYHLGFSGVAGGYIGVEVFFVLSGWLVCALLVNEHQRTGIVGITSFWLRRARRLLPAVVVVVAGTLATASLVAPGQLATVRSHAFAGLAYHLNWRLVADDRSYFEAAAGPSPLEHLWSLSIEEQFYLVFPVLCAFGLVRWGRKRAVAVVAGAAVAATVLRLVLLSPGADPSRVYFGTDTRAAGLLLGVALGLFWTPNRLRPHRDPRFTAALDAVALMGAATLGWYALGLDETSPTAFRAGFAAAQLGTLALIAVAVYPAPTRTVRLLSARPLRWVGQRSYGIYLIHWPVIVFTSRAPGEQPERPATIAVQLALIAGLSALSYRLVELPVRRRGVVAAARDAGDRLRALADGPPLARAAMAAAAVLVCGLTVGVTRDVVTATAPEDAGPASVVIDAAAPTTTAPPAVGDGAPATTAPPAGGAAAPAPTTAPPAGVGAPAAPTPAPGSPYVPTTAIGDSVLVGAAPALSARMGPSLSVDATIGRQMVDADELVATLAAEGRLAPVVLLHLGNNGPFVAEEIDAVLAAIGPDRTVLLVNVYVPRRWEGEVNDQLAAAADRHPNAVLVDWRSLVSGEEGLTRDDGFHLTADGAERYTDLIVGQVPRA